MTIDLTGRVMCRGLRMYDPGELACDCQMVEKARRFVPGLFSRERILSGILLSPLTISFLSSKLAK